MTAMRLTLFGALSVVAIALAGCGGGTVERTGAPPGVTAAAVVPADAALFVGAVTDSESEAWQRVETLLGRFPDGDRLLGELTKSFAEDGVDWERDVKPALGPVSAIVLLRGGGEPVALTKPPLRAKLDALLGKADDDVETRSLEDGWVAIAKQQATLDAYEHALDGPRLADDDEFAGALDGLPGDALAAVFVRPGALNVSGLSGPTGTALPAALAGGFRWAGAALTPADDGFSVEGTVRMDDAPAAYEPTLLRRVPGGAMLAVSFHGDERIFDTLSGEQGLGPFLPMVEGALGVELEDLLGLVKGQGVLYVRPGLPIPEVTLAVETDDAAAAVDTLDRVARKLGADVRPTTVDGVDAHRVAVGPVTVTWAVADGVLVVSTGASALHDFGAGGGKLVDEDTFGRAAERVGLGDRTRGFAYVDVRSVGELVAGLVGLSGDDLPPELTRNLEPLESFAANASDDGDGVRLRAFLSVPGS
jgi:hypothetical protein